jgi:hypothetical protein
MIRRCLLFTAAALTLAGCADNPNEPFEPAGAAAASRSAIGPTVMTRNLYLGADLDPVIGAPAPQLVPVLAAQVWAEVQATNFPARAGALADEIAHAAPHLVGLQEASLYRLQSPSDLFMGGQTPATEVVYDFVALLLDSLSARGMSYVVAAQTVAFDVELPIYTGAAPIPFDDVRLTDREVILARADVATANPQGGLFAARLNINAGGPGGPPVSVTRGWAAVDATAQGHTFRFISTHLEVQSFAPIQVMQGMELLAIAGASPLPVVMLGDFNSAADQSQTPTYGFILDAGFQDVWHKVGNPGYTCCHEKDLLNATSTLDQRLDVIFVRGFDTTGHGSIGAQVFVVGDKPKDRLPSGLWPSDHAGVVATVRIPYAAIATP